MNRLLFVPFWACLFVAAALVATLADGLMWWLIGHFGRGAFDLYLIAPNQLPLFAPLSGALVGASFTWFDWRLNRNADPRGVETARRLGARLVQIVPFAVLWVALQVALGFFFVSYIRHPRYRAYPPDMQWISLFSSFFHITSQVAFALAFVWAMKRALWRDDANG